MKAASARNHAVFAALSACLLGCATTMAVRPGSDAHCLRLIALSEEGASVIEESGAPTFVQGSEGGRKYHFGRRDEDPPRTVTLTEQSCRAERLCDELGARVEDLGFERTHRFAIAHTGAPGEVRVQVPGLGESRISFHQREDRFGEQTWMVAIEREEPWVLYRVPSSFEPADVRWFVAGDVLWLQLQAQSDGLACVAVSSNLREAASGILGADAVTLLREGKLDEARALLERALEVNPHDATAAYNLACAHALKGEEELALEWLGRALWDDPSGRLAALARKDKDLESLWTREEFLQLLAPGGTR